MHNGMKTSMKRVFWILAVLFFLVLATMFKLVAYDRQTIDWALEMKILSAEVFMIQKET